MPAVRHPPCSRTVSPPRHLRMPRGPGRRSDRTPARRTRRRSRRSAVDGHEIASHSGSTLSTASAKSRDRGYPVGGEVKTEAASGVRWRIVLWSRLSVRVAVSVTNSDHCQVAYLSRNTRLGRRGVDQPEQCRKMVSHAATSAVSAVYITGTTRPSNRTVENRKSCPARTSNSVDPNRWGCARDNAVDSGRVASGGREANQRSSSSPANGLVTGSLLGCQRPSSPVLARRP